MHTSYMAHCALTHPIMVVWRQNYWVRRAAAEAVGRGLCACNAEVLNGLARQLCDSHRHVRRQAAISLGQVGTKAKYVSNSVYVCLAFDITCASFYVHIDQEYKWCVTQFGKNGALRQRSLQSLLRIGGVAAAWDSSCDQLSARCLVH
jgi:hypothetical protein